MATKEKIMDARKALDYVSDYHPTMTVAEIYDEDPEFASALNIMFPDFEYPDFSGLTIIEVVKKYAHSL
jgi:hypothetical protein